MRDIAHLLRPGHLAQLAHDPRRPGGVAERSLRRARAAQEREHRGGRRAAVCQDTGTAIVMGKKGQYVFTGGGDEEAIARGVFDTYQTREPALLAARAARHVRGEEHRHQPAGADRDLRDRRRRVQVPVHGQGRRLGEQEPTCSRRPRRCSTRTSLLAFLDAQAALARHRGVPAVSPRGRDRRHVGRARAEDREARVGALPRHAADRRATSSGAASAISSWSSKVLELAQRTGIGAQFGGKYFCHDVRVIRLPRHGASCPVAIAVSCSADRQALGKITRTACSSSSSRPIRRSTCPRPTHDDLGGEVVKIDLRRPMSEIRADAVALPDQDAALAERADDRRARHRAREDQGAARSRARACRST